MSLLSSFGFRFESLSYLDGRSAWRCCHELFVQSLVVVSEVTVVLPSSAGSDGEPDASCFPSDGELREFLEGLSPEQQVMLSFDYRSQYGDQERRANGITDLVGEVHAAMAAGRARNFGSLDLYGSVVLGRYRMNPVYDARSGEEVDVTCVAFMFEGDGILYEPEQCFSFLPAHAPGLMSLKSALEGVLGVRSVFCYEVME